MKEFEDASNLISEEWNGWKPYLQDRGGKTSKEEIMPTRHCRLAFFGLVIVMGLSAAALAFGRTPDVVGEVVNSSNATVEGNALLSNGTILSGDAVYVGEGGSVLLSFSPTGRAALAAATHVRFSSGKGNIAAQLLSGTLSVERENKDAFVVKTSTYSVEPQGEGKTEFLVALLPDKETIVEAQHGKVTITENISGKSYTLAEGLRAEIPPSATGFPDQKEEPGNLIGKVASSAGATRNGNPLPSGGAVFDGDLVSTGTVGSSLIQLSPTSQITLNENTSARFTRAEGRVWLQLQSGTIVAENTGESYVLVATTRFHIVPTSAAHSRIYVGVMTDNSTYIESFGGDVRIEDIPSKQSYLLAAGQNTLVPPNATGVPGLQPMQAAAAPAPKPQSHNAVIILGVAAGGGVAAAVAGLAGSHGGGGQSVSPSGP